MSSPLLPAGAPSPAPVYYPLPGRATPLECLVPHSFDHTTFSSRHTSAKLLFPTAGRPPKWPAPGTSQPPLEDVYVPTVSPTPNPKDDGEAELAVVTWLHSSARRAALFLRSAPAEEYLTTDSPEARLRGPRGDRPGCWVTWLPGRPI